MTHRDPPFFLSPPNVILIGRLSPTPFLAGVQKFVFASAARSPFLCAPNAVLLFFFSATSACLFRSGRGPRPLPSDLDSRRGLRAVATSRFALLTAHSSPFFPFSPAYSRVTFFSLPPDRRRPLSPFSWEGTPCVPDALPPP